MTQQRYHTLVLRVGDRGACEEGTLATHGAILRDRGYVWWAKMGSGLSAQRMDEIRAQRADHSMTMFFWQGRDLTAAHVDEIATQLSVPELDAVPSYYRDRSESVGAWLRVRRLVPLAGRAGTHDVMVLASCQPLSTYTGSNHSALLYVSVEQELMSLLSPAAE